MEMHTLENEKIIKPKEMELILILKTVNNKENGSMVYYKDKEFKPGQMKVNIKVNLLTAKDKVKALFNEKMDRNMKGTFLTTT